MPQIRLKCAGCDQFLVHKKGKKKIIKEEDEAKKYTSSLQRLIVISDILCYSCRLTIYRNKIVRNDDNSQIEQDLSLDLNPEDSAFQIQYKTVEEIPEIEHVEIPMSRTVATHKYCCLCSSTTDLTTIPEEVRISTYVKTIYIPSGNRCCRSHIIKKRIYDEDLRLLKVYSSRTSLTELELSKLMETLTVRCDSSLFKHVGQCSMPEEQLKVFTGLKWDEIMKIASMLTSLRNTESRSVIQALAAFLFKLRLGNSNKMIASIFQLSNEHKVSDYCQNIIKSFENDVLPTRFGIKAANRDDLIVSHTTDMAKKLFNTDDNLFVICDGTYARHQKSTNNEYQRKCFSGQKKVPLCKPFTICTTDGFVIDMLGPFLANQNDEVILKGLIEDPNGLCKLLKEGDIFVLDRGFRDVKDTFEQKNFKVLMPALKGKRNHLSTEEANYSRFVTKIRWPLESVHGVLKQKHRLLDHKLDNKLIPKIGSYSRITSFLNNEFGKRLQSDIDKFDEVLQRMHKQKNESNILATEVEKNGWLRRKLPFQSVLADDLQDFPEMTERDLQILFTGSYQLFQAVSYLSEMMDEDGKLKLEYVKDQSNVLKVRVPSRHTSRTTYRCFLRYK